MTDILKRKKDLLKKRENLLVEIGLDLVNNATLSESHQNVPRDLERSDHMIQEQVNRLQTLEKKREASRFHLERLSKKENELNHREEERTKPLIEQLDNLEKEVSTNPKRKSELAKIKQELGVKKNQFLLLKQEIEDQKKELEQQDRSAGNQIDEIRATVDMLEETRRKRLRDLAYDYYIHHKKDSMFATKFGHFRLIQLELQELNATEKPNRGLQHIRDERKHLSWLWAPALVIISLIVFLVFKGEFSTKELSAAGFALDFPQQQGEQRWMFDMESTNEYQNRIAENALRLVPDLDILERNGKDSAIESLAWSLGSQNNLRFAILEFKAPREGLENDIQTAGWTRKKNSWGVEAFQKGAWSFYRMTPNQFLFLPTDTKLPPQPSTDSRDVELMVHTRIEPFDDQHPLVAGYTHFHMTKSRIDFEWSLSPDEAPHDLNQRTHMLETLAQKKLLPSGLEVQFEGSVLKARGPASLLLGWTDVSDCLQWVATELPELKGHAPKDIPWNELGSPIDDPAKTTTPLFSFYHLNGQLQLTQAFDLPGQLTDFFVESKRNDLWALDRGLVRIFHFEGSDLVLKRIIHLAAGFQPQRMQVKDAMGRVILFDDPEHPRQFGLIDLQREAWLTSGKAPENVLEITCAEWAPEFGHLYLGVMSSGQWNQRGSGLLVYKDNDGNPALKQLVDFQIGRTGQTGLSALFYHRAHRVLYGLNPLQSTLNYFQVENGLVGPTNGVLLDQMTMVRLERQPIIYADPAQWTVTRNQDAIILLDGTDFSGKRYGRQAFYVDCNSNPPIIKSSTDLGHFPHAITHLPLGRHYAAIAGPDREIVLFHHDEENLEIDSRMKLNNYMPRRLASNTFGNQFFVLAKEN